MLIYPLSYSNNSKQIKLFCLLFKSLLRSSQERMTLLPSMNMLSQCLFISTKTQVFVKISVLLLTWVLWIKKKLTHYSGSGRGSPDPAFPPLFRVNRASRTFFISFPNPAFLSQKSALKSLISKKLINVRCMLILSIDILNFRLFLEASAKRNSSFFTSIWRELASLFAISRPI